MTLQEFIAMVEANRVKGQLVDLPIRLEIRGEGVVTRNGVVVKDDEPINKAPFLEE